MLNLVRNIEKRSFKVRSLLTAPASVARAKVARIAQILTRTLPIFPLVLACLPTANAQTQANAPASGELIQLREEIDQLTSDYGRLDRRLLEPLEIYGKLLNDAGRLEEALVIIDEGMSITRISEGLDTQSQFPFLLEKIENLGNSGEWEKTAEWMRHLRELLENEKDINEEVIATGMQLTELHLWSVARSSRGMQNYHFRQAMRANEVALRQAKVIWGNRDTRLVPMMYKLVLQHHMQVVAIDARGKTSLGLREIAAIDIVLPRKEVKNTHFFSGLRYLTEIQALFIEQEEQDLVGIAMAEMYQADWQVLFANSQAAAYSYQQAFDVLLLAGIEQESINQYFRIPVMLPAPSFINNWDEAIATVAEARSTSVQRESAVSLNFSEWSANFPFIMPEVALRDSNLNQSALDGPAIFTFSLAGLEKVSHWYQGRYKTFISAPRDLEMVNERLSRSYESEVLENIVHNMRFRPRLLDGVPQAVDATLDYRVAVTR